jgi:serine/threonine protein kinase
MDSSQVLARFEAERQALAIMDHPNIAKVLDAGQTPGPAAPPGEGDSPPAGVATSGRPYFAMELVKGVPITAFCDKNKLTMRQRLELFIPVCNAIQHAHMKGIIHRDIKPSNVLIALYDGKPVPKVIDFGVAKAMAEPLTQRTLFTQIGQIVGTFEYMSPEQATLNQLDIDTRSDIYSLGVLLYELLTGVTPFDKDQLRKLALDQMLRTIREEEPMRPSVRLSSAAGALAMAAAYRGVEAPKLAGLLRGDLDWIVMKALEKERDRRFVTAGSLAQDIERYLRDEPVTACPPSLSYRAHKAYRKNKAAIFVTATIIVLLLAGIIGSTWQAFRATRAERIATVNEVAARTAEDNAIRERDNVATANEKLGRSMELQRKTRYAAEMNLVQAAYNAKDMQQVKKLLTAQVPKPGEPDDRGPEWHYWDRRLNGHEKEITLPIYPTINPGGTAISAAFSPDGRRLANVVVRREADPADKPNLRSMKIIAQVWDVETGELAKKREWDLRADLNVPKNQDMYFVAGLSPSVEFVKGGRELVIRVQNMFRQNGLAGSTLWKRDLLWNPETNESKTLFARDFERRGDRVIPMSAALTAYTDDLSLQASFRFDPEAGERVLEVGRLDDPKKELLRKALPNVGVGRMNFSPDGRYLIATLADARPTGAQPTPLTNLRTALWKIGSGPDPLWVREDEMLQRVDAGNRPMFYRTFAFSADGKTYSDYRYGPMGVAVDTYDLETRKLMHSRPLVNADSTAAGSVAGLPRNRSVMVAIDARNGWIATPSATGVAVRRLDPPPRSAPEALVDYESLDGPPLLVAFRPDGSLVTLHSEADWRFDDELSPTSKLRSWPKAPTAALDATTSAGSMYPIFNKDRTRAAFLIAEVPPVIGPGTQPKPLRLVVADHTGAKLLDVPSTDRQPLSAIEGGQDGLGAVRDTGTGRVARFSADGRYILYCVHTPSRNDPPDTAEAFDTVVIHDLEKKEDVNRLRQEPGLELLLIRPSPEGSRLLVATGVRVPRKDAGPFDPIQQTDTQVRSARLYEFSSGRPIADLKLPADKTLAGFRATRQGWQGYADRRIAPDGAALPHWETETGNYLGELQAEPRQARQQPLPTRREIGDRVERGGRVLRRIQTTEETGRFTGMIMEVWDAARQGEGDRPLFTIEETATFQAYLSPDGKRLLVSDAGQSVGRGSGSCTLYCTDTGRPLLSPPDLRSTRFLGIGSFSPFDPVGFWSADGRQFWARMDPEGNLFGYDFRPRETAKK